MREDNKDNDRVGVAIGPRHRPFATVDDEDRGWRYKKKGKWVREAMMKGMMLILMRISAGGRS